VQIYENHLLVFRFEDGSEPVELKYDPKQALVIKETVSSLLRILSKKQHLSKQGGTISYRSA
jgi:hypothetical protein